MQDIIGDYAQKNSKNREWKCCLLSSHWDKLVNKGENSLGTYKLMQQQPKERRNTFSISS